MSWRGYARKLGLPCKRLPIIKRAEYEAWARRRQRRQSLKGFAMIIALAAVAALWTWGFLEMIL